jgi:TfoX/Sxy family transcriptional regulator of competence genes
MTYDEGLATRLRDALAAERGSTEKKMFGGLALLVDGHIAVGVYGDGLLVPVDPGGRAALLAEPGVEPFAMGGRTMRGWLFVSADRCAEDADLMRWVSHGVARARGL